MGRYQKYQRKLKYITVLGSTGSIGTQTLEIASEQPDKFKAVALSAGRNINLLTEQVKIHKPEVIAIEDENKCLIVGPIFIELTEEGKIRRLRDKIRKNGLTININQ